MKNLLLLSYIGLGLILVGCVIIALIAVPTSFAESFSLNLATEVIGIGLTIFLIDKVVERQQNKERERYRQVAIQRLRNPLTRHVGFLFEMFKACVKSKPKKEFVNVSDLFNKTFFDEISHLDFAKPAPITNALTGSPTWAYYLVRETKALNDSLSAILEKYSLYMDVELIHLIERVLDKSLYSFVSVIQGEVVADEGRGIKRAHPWFTNVAGHVVGEHVWPFQELVEYYNNHVTPEHKIMLNQTWRNNVAPPIGSARA